MRRIIEPYRDLYSVASNPGRHYAADVAVSGILIAATLGGAALLIYGLVSYFG